MPARTNDESLVRGHASWILLPGNENMLDRARQIVSECLPVGSHLIAYHPFTRKELDNLDDLPIDKYGYQRRQRKTERFGHITVCINYVLMDMQSVAFLVQNPTYPAPATVNAWSVCEIQECCAIAHLVPGQLTPSRNPHDASNRTE